jgi:hypothetical protein
VMRRNEGAGIRGVLELELAGEIGKRGYGMKMRGIGMCDDMGYMVFVICRQMPTHYLGENGVKSSQRF